MRRSDLPGNLGPLRGAIEAALDRLAQTEAIGRLWRRDGTLWTTDPKTARSIEERLGWLGTPEAAEDFLAPVEAFRREVAAARQIVLLGMGGSSLAPEVMAGALPRNGPPLIVLDSTAPEAVRAVEQIGLEHTVFVVSSKSGTTTETRTLAAYFLHHAAPPPGRVGWPEPRTPRQKAGEGGGAPPGGGTGSRSQTPTTTIPTAFSCGS